MQLSIAIEIEILVMYVVVVYTSKFSLACELPCLRLEARTFLGPLPRVNVLLINIGLSFLRFGLNFALLLRPTASPPFCGLRASPHCSRL